MKQRASSSIPYQRQRGFVTLLVIVVIGVILTLWISTQHQSVVSIFKTKQVQTDEYALQQVKKRLLAYATLHPELYQSSSAIPAPGFLPCPDLNGDGDILDTGEISCSNPFEPGKTTLPYEKHTGFVPNNGLSGFSSVHYGYVPESIANTYIHFAEAGRYHYFLDERFSFNNGAYTSNHFNPMNAAHFVGEVDGSTLSDSTDAFEPLLTLNERTGYIALIIDAGADGLDADNGLDADGYVDRHFTSKAEDMSEDPSRDKIVGITFDEWNNAINRRVCSERFRYEGLVYADKDEDGTPDIANPFSAIDAAEEHWYNDFHVTDNPLGTNLRSANLLCSYE